MKKWRNWLLAAFIICLPLLIAGYGFDLPILGFSDYTYVKADGEIEFQRGKTLWDWMQLLIIPVALLIAGIFFNRIEKQLEQQRAEERAQLEQQRAEERAQLEQQRAEERTQLERQRVEDTQREAALQTYLDQMGDLLLKGLRSSEPGSELRDIARVRTLTTVQRLDPARCTIVFRFLHDAGLASNTAESIVDLTRADFRNKDMEGIVIGPRYLTRTILNGANLKQAYLSGANLEQAHLEGTNLEGAYLRNTILEQANLRKANLEEANLQGANLKGANLEKTNLKEVNLNGANLGGATLKAANLEGASLNGANLQGANLEEAYLLSTDLHGANLEQANLARAQLYYTSLIDATLIGANLRDVELEGAKLIRANLERANITQDELLTCATLRGATLPDGTKVPNDQDFPAGWKSEDESSHRETLDQVLDQIMRGASQ